MAVKDFLSHDIPFKRDDAHRLLPAMIACLVGFAALLLALAMTLTSTLHARASGLSGTLQVEVSAGKSSAPLIEEVKGALIATPGVTEVRAFTQEEMEALLKPLLGNQFSFEELPVPTLIDVTTKVHDDRTTVDLEALEKRLKTIHNEITLKENGAWVGRMVGAASVLQGVILLVAVLLLGCVLGMIILVAKTNLRLHFKTVRLLHMFGATDEYILRQFQRNSAMLVGRGSVIGVVVVAAFFVAAAMASQRIAGPLVPVIELQMAHGIIFMALPIFTALTALLATRFTVQSMLQQMH